jgi:hypothetical protein
MLRPQPQSWQKHSENGAVPLLEKAAQERKSKNDNHPRT